MRSPLIRRFIVTDANSQKTTARELLTLAWPMVVSQGAFALMIFTDRFFLSMVSPTHMGAALGGGVASYFCMSLFIGALSYANALVAQYFGQQAFEKCTRVLTQGLLLCALADPLLVVMGFGAMQLFTLMGHAPEQIELEESYFLILLWGAIAALVKTCFGSYFTRYRAHALRDGGRRAERRDQHPAHLSARVRGAVPCRLSGSLAPPGRPSRAASSPLPFSRASTFAASTACTSPSLHPSTWTAAFSDAGCASAYPRASSSS